MRYSHAALASPTPRAEQRAQRRGDRRRVTERDGRALSKIPRRGSAQDTSRVSSAHLDSASACRLGSFKFHEVTELVIIYTAPIRWPQGPSPLCANSPPLRHPGRAVGQRAVALGPGAGGSMRMLVFAGICAMTTSGFLLRLPRADTCRSSGPVMRLTEEQAIALSDVDLPAWMGVPLREIPKAYDFRRLTTGEFLPSSLWCDNYVRVRARRGLRTFDPDSLNDIREFHALMRLDARVRMPKVRKYLLERREREARKRLAADRLRLERLVSCQVSEVTEAEEAAAPGELGVHLEEKNALLARENEQLRAELAEEKNALLTRENEQLRAELARLRAQSCPPPPQSENEH